MRESNRPSLLERGIRGYLPDFNDDDDDGDDDGDDDDAIDDGDLDHHLREKTKNQPCDSVADACQQSVQLISFAIN